MLRVSQIGGAKALIRQTWVNAECLIQGLVNITFLFLKDIFSITSECHAQVPTSSLLIRSIFFYCFLVPTFLVGSSFGYHLA